VVLAVAAARGVVVVIAAVTVAVAGVVGVAAIVGVALLLLLLLELGALLGALRHGGEGFRFEGRRRGEEEERGASDGRGKGRRGIVNPILFLAGGRGGQFR